MSLRNGGKIVAGGRPTDCYVVSQFDLCENVLRSGNQPQNRLFFLKIEIIPVQNQDFSVFSIQGILSNDPFQLFYAVLAVPGKGVEVEVVPTSVISLGAEAGREGVGVGEDVGE